MRRSRGAATTACASRAARLRRLPRCLCPPACSRTPRRCRRDALFLGDCDDGVRQLCALLGWEADLEALVVAGRAGFHPQYAAPAEAPAAGGATYQ